MAENRRPSCIVVQQVEATECMTIPDVQVKVKHALIALSKQMDITVAKLLYLLLDRYENDSKKLTSKDHTHVDTESAEEFDAQHNHHLQPQGDQQHAINIPILQGNDSTGRLHNTSELVVIKCEADNTSEQQSEQLQMSEHEQLQITQHESMEQDEHIDIFPNINDIPGHNLVEIRGHFDLDNTSEADTTNIHIPKIEATTSLQTIGAHNNSHNDTTWTLETAVTNVLGNIANLREVVDRLVTEIGVESHADLALVIPEDLSDHLRPIQCRRLIKAWHSATEPAAPHLQAPASTAYVHPPNPSFINQPASISTAPTSISPLVINSTLTSTSIANTDNDLLHNVVVNTKSSTTSSSELNMTLTEVPPFKTKLPPNHGPNLPIPDKNWEKHFEIDYQRMPHAIQMCLFNKSRPNPSDRKRFVRLVVAQMRTKCLNPTLSQVMTISKKVISKYPLSFQDHVTDGSVSATLTRQLKNRIDHINRGLSYARLRKGKRNKTVAPDDDACSNDSFIAPSDRTDESINVDTSDLSNIFQQEYQNSSSSLIPTTVLIPPPPIDWVDNFQVDWLQMPLNIKRCLYNRYRLTHTDRKRMVRLIVDQMREECLNPTLQQVTMISHGIVNEFPNSFQDQVDGQCVGSGIASLSRQLKNRIEHINRGIPSVRLRACKSCVKIADAYGCPNYSPKVPLDETEESLENYRQELVAMFHQQNQLSWGKVDKLMSNSFFAQRLDINQGMDIHALRDKWPYLFLENNLLKHFEILTEVNQQRLVESMANQRNHLFHYLQSSKKSSVQDLVSGAECSDALIILGLLAELNEKVDALILVKDPSVIDDISDGLPLTPRLIIQGPSVLLGSQWSISVDGHVAISSCSSFLMAVTCLFASYFVFNISYDIDAEAMLEFIQRSFMNIQPWSGTKCAKVQNTHGLISRRKPPSVNPKVIRLINDIADHN